MQVILNWPLIIWGDKMPRHVKFIVDGKVLKIFPFNNIKCILPDDVERLIDHKGVFLEYATADEFMQDYVKRYGHPVLR